MNHQNHQNRQSGLGVLNWRPHFPYNLFSEPRPVQVESLDVACQNPKSLQELPTGSGKTAIGITYLKTVRAENPEGTLFYIVPNKALVNQVALMHPNDVEVLYGRSDYPCPFFRNKGVEGATADNIPCFTVVKKGLCPHYVPSLAEVPPSEIEPCPYYLAKAQALGGKKIVVSTMARFLLTQFFGNGPDKVAGLVADEVHQLANTARSVFSYDITDYHVLRLIKFLEPYDPVQAERLKSFLDELIKIAKLKPAKKPINLKAHEIENLLNLLKTISFEEAEEKIGRALETGEIDPFFQAEELKTLEQIARDLKRYINSFIYALGRNGQNPLNYIFAYYEKRIGKKEKVRYRLSIRAHYVVSIVRRCLKDAERILAYSATIGDTEAFSFENGVDFPFSSFASSFPVENSRLFLPSDTPDLSVKNRGQLDKYTALRKIAEAVSVFKEKGIRSLVVVISNEEREKFLELGFRNNIQAVSYGNGVTAREAAAKFRDGEGDVLVGTAANYSHGIDLPRNIAPVIFFFRPGYPRPDDPATQFEEERFRGLRWKLWTYRVILEALQTRGRNIRSGEDVGVCFFISQQFGRFLPGGLPEWLREAWVSEKTMDECVQETIQLLSAPTV